MITALSIVGSGFAILAILADLLGRHGWGIVKRGVESLGLRVHFRTTASPVENLRQMLALIASLLLSVLAVVTNNPVYVALQLMLVASSLLWYVQIGPDLERSESIKTYVRAAIAIGIWVALEIAGLCPGFHRLGVIGLETLGCGFIVSRPLVRDSLCFAGGVLLSVYAGMGMVFEPENLAHLNWLILNLIYSVLGLLALIDSIRKSRTGNATDPTNQPK